MTFHAVLSICYVFYGLTKETPQCKACVKNVKFEGTTAKDGLTMKEALTLGKIIQGYYSCETVTGREKRIY
jgi:hypothetical protein